MRSTTELPLPAGAVAVPPELDRIWGFVPMTRDWRWLATSPRFDVTAPLAAEMWEKATGQRVDGVLALDPVTLEALLRAQGPIEVDNRRLSADDVLKFLLLDQYTFADANTPEQVARRDQLSGVAKAAVDTLETRSWNPDRSRAALAVGSGTSRARVGARPAEQRAWTAAGVGGELHATPSPCHS